MARLACLLCSAIVSAACVLCGETAPPATVDPERLRALVRQLGADDYDKRVAAYEELSRAGDAARGVLGAARDTDDAEIRVSVARLLKPFLTRDRANEDWRTIERTFGPLFGARQMALSVEPPAQDATPGAGVEAALEWLAKAQEQDGHWDSRKYGAEEDADIEQTSLALLCFLGAGHTEKVGEHKGNVKRAVAWLAQRMRADGAVVRDGADEPDGLTHALVCLALAEAAGMANRPATKATAQKALNYLTQSHQSGTDDEKGGFGRKPQSSEPELLTTTLAVIAMQSAKVAGLKVPPSSFDGVIRFLDLLEDKAGWRFAPGQQPSPRAGLLGCLSRQFLGWGSEDLYKQAQRAVDGYGDVGTASTDEFHTYVATLVTFQQGGELWQRFDGRMKNSIVQRQERDGPAAGSWSARGPWKGAGRVFATAVNVLCLEVYYRYLQLQP